MKTFQFAGSRGKATCMRIAPAAYQVTGATRYGSFDETFTGIGAREDAWLCAKLAAFDGRLPRKQSARTGDTLVGVPPVDEQECDHCGRIAECSETSAGTAQCVFCDAEVERMYRYTVGLPFAEVQS